MSAAERCADFDQSRRALFGDLHVHTGLSSDAWMFDVRLGPSDAYRYAFGGEVALSPAGANGQGSRPVRIDRPLDFAAVTDHAEFLGETLLCSSEGAEGYESDFCQEFRKGKGRSIQLLWRVMSPWSWRDGDLCGEHDEHCRRASASGWRQAQAAAAEWNQPCQQTTFVAYEYSSHRLGSNLHRNVIFADEKVPEVPISYLEAGREWELWEQLQAECIDRGDGCDVLAIPHNSNISNGRMFAVDYPGAWGEDAQRQRAELRARIEPVVEIMQHKGDSECRNGLEGVIGGADELCGFEKFSDFVFRDRGNDPPSTCYDGPLADYVPHLGPDCLSRRNYARYALVEGLIEERRLGVNPFKFGLMASTDTHNALAGGVDERTFPGHLGAGDDTAAKRTVASSEVAGNANNNPGGLVGVWAEENSRESIFAALRRREVFGTSGPRIQLRLFGGWGLADDLCAAPDMVRKAYASGVPMGADLPPGEGAPSFVVSALRDPGTADSPGGWLQRVQIIKGWADDEDQIHQEVYEVVGDPDNGASVDASCRPQGGGSAALCGVWRDPDFDPERRAVYYARAVENPSCRYSAWQCLGATGEMARNCRESPMPRVIQERAWSSPIWYTPAGDSAASH